MEIIGLKISSFKKKNSNYRLKCSKREKLQTEILEFVYIQQNLRITKLVQLLIRDDKETLYYQADLARKGQTGKTNRLFATLNI